MSNLTLIDLNLEFSKYIEKLESVGGELTPEMELEIQNLENAIIQKADSAYWVLTKLEAEADFFKSQADRLIKFSKVCQNAHERLKDRIKVAVQASPDNIIQGETVAFKLRNNPGSVVIVDESKVPKEYLETVITTKVNKKQAKEDLQAGIPVPGLRLEIGQSLQITRPSKGALK